MNWQEKFRLVVIQPGKVKTSLFGMVDFSDPNLPVETVEALYESGLPCLEPAPESHSEISEDAPPGPPGKRAPSKNKT